MKRLIATTAMALALTTGAHAQTGFDSFSSEQFEHGTHFYASNLIGMRIYASETAGKEDFRYTEGAEKEWDDIGEVDDVILNRNGEIEAVILGVGGFLGLGEKDIAVSMSELRVVGEHDDADDYFLVVDGNRDTLVDTPAYDHAERESASVDTPVHDGTRTSAVAEQMDRPGEHADARPVPAAPANWSRRARKRTRNSALSRPPRLRLARKSWKACASMTPATRTSARSTTSSWTTGASIPSFLTLAAFSASPSTASACR